MLLPRDGGPGYTGTASAVQQNLDVLGREQPDLVAVFAADHVYRMDLRQMAAFHRARAAQVTVSAVAVPIGSAPSFGVIAAHRDGTVREFQEKPRDPRPLPGDASRAYASMGNYLFEPGVLAQALRRGGAARRNRFRPPRAAATAGALSPCTPTTWRKTCCPACARTRSRPTGATSGRCRR